MHPLSVFLEPTETTFKLRKVKDHLWEHELISEMMEGVNIILDRSIETYEIDKNHILINPKLRQEDAFLIIVKCLRLINQEHADPLRFHPDHAIIYNRLLYADAEVFMCKVAWEMRLQGYRQYHDRLLDVEFYDLAGFIATMGKRDFRTLRNGEMMSYGVEHWYVYSDRCTEVDRALVKKMLEINPTELSDLRLECSDLSALGQCGPTNYLSKTAHILLEDCVFTEVRDRSTANFLWLIKFERSFNETERYELREI